MTSRYGGAPLCPRCEKAVYMAEQVIGPNGSWHRACLTCFECKKRLDSFALAEHEGEAYCKTCYGRRFGPKGYGFASGTAFLSTENAKPLNNHNNNNHTNNNINRRSSTSSTASSLSSSTLIKDKDESNSDNNILNNKLSQSPPRPPSSLSNYSTSTISSTTSSSSTISNNSSYGFFSTRSYSSPRGSLISGGGGQKRSWTLPVNNDICPRCTKPVYAAEAVLGAGVKYHRLCLRCENCSKLLDSTNMTDRDGKIYCSPCYSKEFGPKGYGYGSGAAFLTTEGAR